MLTNRPKNLLKTKKVRNIKIYLIKSQMVKNLLGFSSTSLTLLLAWSAPLQNGQSLNTIVQFLLRSIKASIKSRIQQVHATNLATNARTGRINISFIAAAFSFSLVLKSLNHLCLSHFLWFFFGLIAVFRRPASSVQHGRICRNLRLVESTLIRQTGGSCHQVGKFNR